MKTKTILLLGRPGAGKGTQANLLAKELGWRHVASGDLFRALRGNHDEFGERIRKDYDTGRLLPDSVAMYLFKNEIFKFSRDDGVIFDGFGRNARQAHEIHEVLTWLERPYRAIELGVSEREAVRRQVERSKKEHRPDSDTEEKILQRTKQQERELATAVAVFNSHNLFYCVAGEKAVQSVHDSLRQLVHQFP